MFSNQDIPKQSRNNVFLILACISTPQLNSMHVETNESVSASHLRKQNPIYSNTSQSAVGMNMNSIRSQVKKS